MDLKNPRQNPANFSHNQNCANVSTQKNVNKKKFIKVLGAGGLALVMGAGVLFGTLLAPVGATSASNSGDPAALAQSADSALTPQEQLLAGTGLGLDPENDPVVFTTDYGLEIKYANALTNTNLAGYTYFTMGEYDGTPINWVIIGYSPNMAQFVGEFTGETGPDKNPTQGENNQIFTVDDTPAGMAVRHDMLAISSEAVESAELLEGCVLCLCAGTIGTIAHSSIPNPKTSFYVDLEIGSAISTIYNNITSVVRNAIQLTSLKTFCYSGGYRVIEHEEYLFPLATSDVNSSQNFCIETYIGYGTKANIGVQWWLRSGNNGYPNKLRCVNSSGSAYNSDVYGGPHYLRPAFVLKI